MDVGADTHIFALRPCPALHTLSIPSGLNIAYRLIGLSLYILSKRFTIHDRTKSSSRDPDKPYITFNSTSGTMTGIIVICISLKARTDYIDPL